MDNIRLNNILPALVFFTAGIWLLALHSINYFSAIPGDLGDARFNSVVLEHFYQWITGLEKFLWSPRFFYPNEHVLAFSDNHFGTAWIYSLFRIIGFERESAFQWWYLISYPVNFFICFYVLRKFNLSGVPAAFGAFIFTFGLPVGAQVGHAQLMYRFAIPLAILSWWRLCKYSDIREFTLTVVWLVIQFFCSIYTGYFLSLLLVAFTVGMWIESTRPRKWGPLNTIVVAIWTASTREKIFNLSVIIIALLALVSLLLPYYQVTKEYNFSVRTLSGIASMLPTVKSYFLADSASLSAWPGKSFAGVDMRHEHQLFIGFGVLIIMLSGLWSALRKETPSFIRALIWATGLLMILTLSIKGKSIYLLFATLPGVESIQAVSRIVMVFLFSYCVVSAFGVEKIWRNKASNEKIVIFLLMVLAIVEIGAYQTRYTPIVDWQKRIKELRAKLPTDISPDSILVVPSTGSVGWLDAELDGMILAQDMNVSTINGYSGNAPPGVTTPSDCGAIIMRLSAFLESSDYDRDYFQQFRKRIVPVGLNGCADILKSEILPIPHAGPLPDDIYNKISLKSVSVEVMNKKELKVTLQISNQSNERLPAVSSTHTPVRLSWRFVHADSGQYMSGWDFRREITSDIQPGSEIIQSFIVRSPNEQGKYALEISMVQDGVAWFHERGMALATSNVIVIEG